MANVFARLIESIENDVHSLLDRKDEKNPVQALNQYLRQSEKETEKVRLMIGRQHKLKEEFARERKQADDMADKRKKQAEIAREAGETELAEYAEREYEEYAARAERLTLSQVEAMKQLESLETKYEEMNHKLKDMRLKRMELMGRENTARARHQLSKITDESGDRPYARFEELERYIDELEQKVNSDYYRHTFDSKIARLEKSLQEKENESGNGEKMV